MITNLIEIWKFDLRCSEYESRPPPPLPAPLFFFLSFCYFLFLLLLIYFFPIVRQIVNLLYIEEKENKTQWILNFIVLLAPVI